MQKDDSVYAGHMLDMARKAMEKIRGMNRSEYDADEDLRMAPRISSRQSGRQLAESLRPFSGATIPFRGARSSVCATRSSTATSKSTTISCGIRSEQAVKSGAEVEILRFAS